MGLVEAAPVGIEVPAHVAVRGFRELMAVATLARADAETTNG